MKWGEFLWSEVKFNAYSSGEIKKLPHSTAKLSNKFAVKDNKQLFNGSLPIFSGFSWPGYFISLPHRSLTLTLFYAIWIIYSHPPNTHTHTHTHTYLHTNTPTHTHTNTRIQTHIYTHIHTHAHLYILEAPLLHHCTPTKQITPSKVFQYFAQ